MNGQDFLLASANCVQQAGVVAVQPDPVTAIIRSQTAPPNAIGETIRPLDTPLTQLLRDRKTRRKFDGLLTRMQIETLLADCIGGVERIHLDELDIIRQTIPQSGGIAAVRVHAIVLHPAEDMPSGIYTLYPSTNGVYRVADAPEASGLTSIFDWPEPDLSTVHLIMTISADCEKKAYKYGDRGYRYAMIESGCALQNLLLSAATQNIAACTYGGFIDILLAQILGLDFPQECPFVTVFLGAQVQL